VKIANLVTELLNGVTALPHVQVSCISYYLFIYLFKFNKMEK